MTKDILIKCKETIGHKDKLTRSKKYKVLNEWKEYLNLRIKDDRGIMC